MEVTTELEFFTLHFRCVGIVKKSAFSYAFERFKALCLKHNYVIHFYHHDMKLIKFKFILIRISYQYKFFYLKHLFLKLETTKFSNPEFR